MSLYRRYSLPLLILTLLFLFMLMAVYPQSSLNAGLRGLPSGGTCCFRLYSRFSLFPSFSSVSELFIS